MAVDSTGTRSVHNTLAGTTVDTVILQGHWAAVEVVNRAAAGGAALWVTVGKKGDATSATPNQPGVQLIPSAAANETFFIPGGASLMIECPNGVSVQPQVLLLGNGNDYSVTGAVDSDGSNRATLV